MVPGGGGGSGYNSAIVAGIRGGIIGLIGLFLVTLKLTFLRFHLSWVKLAKQQQVHLQQVVMGKVKVTQPVVYPGSGGQTVTGTKFIHWQSLAKKNGKYPAEILSVQIFVCLPKPKS